MRTRHLVILEYPACEPGNCDPADPACEPGNCDPADPACEEPPGCDPEYLFCGAPPPDEDDCDDGIDNDGDGFIDKEDGDCGGGKWRFSVLHLGVVLQLGVEVVLNLPAGTILIMEIIMKVSMLRH